jgi:uncharacterized protein (TIGR03067 family)
MSYRGLVVMAAAFMVIAVPSHGEAPDKDTAKIQGSWKVVSLEADGDQGPVEIVAKLKLVFKDGNLTFTPGEPGFTNYEYKLDPSTKPPSFDMTHAGGKDKGDTTKGIYAMDGDDLKICFGKDGQRPKKFTAKAESGQTMYVLKREKP